MNNFLTDISRPEMEKTLLCNIEQVEKAINLGAPFSIYENVSISQMFDWLATCSHGIRPALFYNNEEFSYMTNCYDGCEEHKMFNEIKAAYYGAVDSCLNIIQRDDDDEDKKETNGISW